MKKLVALASVVVLGGSLGLAALFASSAPSFAPAKGYPTGRAPISVAIGDLNSDGKPDLATANFEVGVNSVSVLLNRGDGSFQAKRGYRTGRRPSSVAIGDLNGDRNPDLATTNNAAGVNTVSVLFNRGDGSFQAKLEYRTGGASSIEIGDLNGDGKSDLATANSEASTVSVLINTPGLCTVQDVGRRFLRERNVVVPGQTLPAAKRTMARANCRVGKIRRAYSKNVKKGRVISQKPDPGTVLPNRGKVNLVVSLGRRPA